MKSPKVKIVQDTDKPIATEIIAQSIIEISRGFKKIREGRLNDNALLILLGRASGIPMVDCQQVLRALESLESRYLKKAQS